MSDPEGLRHGRAQESVFIRMPTRLPGGAYGEQPQIAYFLAALRARAASWSNGLDLLRFADGLDFVF